MTSVTVHDSVEAWGVQAPTAVALIDQRQSLTREELSRLANFYGRALQQSGVGPGDLVGLLAERSAELVIGLLAILKTGAAYVPLDPTCPSIRRVEISRETGIKVVVTTPRTQWLSDGSEARTVCISADDRRAESSTQVRTTYSGKSLAAVVYTSGSRGRPKGVMIPHSAIVSRAHDLICDQPDVCLWRAPPTVIAHISNLLLPLMTGRVVLTAPDDVTTDPSKFARFVRAHGITRLALVPSHLRALLEIPEFVRPSALRTIVLSGESVPVPLVRLTAQLMPNVTLVNAYGTTETTGLVCQSTIDSRSGIAIGRREVAGNLHILDQDMRPVSTGTIGELCVTGPQLALGYFADPLLTAERFKRAPEEPSEMLYRTGDLACFNPEGRIEIMGRLDRHVKLRGFRVNLSEVESVLEQHEGVEQAVAIVQGGRMGAYVLGHTDPAQVRAYSRNNLPSYMVPGSIQVVRDLPLLPDGKVDRESLMGRQLEQDEEIGVDAAPKTPTEEVLVHIWESVFERTPIDLSLGFLEIGGDSLDAIRILAHVARSFDRTLTLEQLFDHPTIELLARFIDRGE